MSYRNNYSGEFSSGFAAATESDPHEFGCLPRLPAILTDVQTGWLLGFTCEAIGTLVVEKFLKPLGAPGPKDEKRFSSVYILALAGDRQWLDRATDVIYQSRRKPDNP